MAPKLTLYIDTVSPFAYLAYYILRNDPVFKSCEITYVPIFLGAVMKACGNTPPMKIKNKGAWIAKERLRWARLFKIPIAQEMPKDFPPLTLTVMRGLCAVTILHPGEKGQKSLAACLDALLAAFWVESRNITDKDVLTAELTRVLGAEDTGKVLEMAGKEGKELLATNTDLALADGAFGLPWFVATNEAGEKEAFWGVDHLAQVTEHLGLEKPKTGGWKALL